MTPNFMQTWIACFLFIGGSLFATSDTEELCCGFVFDAYPLPHAPHATHRIAFIATSGDSIELEDGSIWKIGRYDWQKGSYLHLRDLVTITQNNRWFSYSPYRIIDQRTGLSLEAELARGPLYPSLAIETIDREAGTILLANTEGEKTVWEVSQSDRALFANWTSNDPLIIGQNSDWDQSCKGLLINATLNHSIRIKQYE